MAHRSDSLAERLVQVALEILAEAGPEGLTLREAARRAGVSHGAPLRPFRSLSDLRSEVAARGFSMLSEAVEKSAAQLAPGAGAAARLGAAARAYVHSAVASPALFALMFRPELLDPENASLREHSSAAFEQLVLLVRTAQDAGWQEGRDTRLLAGSVWAAMHGLATLWAQRALGSVVPGASLDDALDLTLELLQGDCA